MKQANKSLIAKQIAAGDKALGNVIIASLILVIALIVMSFATEFYPFYALVKGWPVIAVLFLLLSMAYVKDAITNTK